jgi:hypothetical protein
MRAASLYTVLVNERNHHIAFEPPIAYPIPLFAPVTTAIRGLDMVKLLKLEFVEGEESDGLNRLLIEHGPQLKFDLMS